MKKLIGHFLREPEEGYLWLHTYTYDTEYYVEKPSGRLDLTTCDQVDAEIVSAKFFHIFGPAVQLLVARDQNGKYAAFTLFMDSLGFGSIYASITPGFTFKSVYCFNQDLDIYIISEDLEGYWGVIRVSFLTSIPTPWRTRGAYVPHEIVQFEYQNMQAALEHCSIAEAAAKNGKLIDMTKPTKEMDMFDGDGPWGATLEQIVRSRHPL